MWLSGNDFEDLRSVVDDGQNYPGLLNLLLPVPVRSLFATATTKSTCLITTLNFFEGVRLE